MLGRQEDVVPREGPGGRRARWSRRGLLERRGGLARGRSSVRFVSAFLICRYVTKLFDPSRW